MAIKRLRYFDNQFLVEADFTDEQKYHLDMRRRLNRALHTFGIAEGLEVVKKTNKIVTVRPGVAIDGLGREIILEAAQDVDLSAISTAVPAFITIAYQEKQTDRSTAGVGDTRVTEQPILPPAVTTPPPTDGTVIRLASITLAAGGTVPGNINDVFDGGVRQAAGPRGERGLASLDGVSNPAGNIDLVQAQAIVIAPDDANNRITIGESHSARTNNPHNVTAAQTGALVSVAGVSNPGGSIDLIPANAIAITPDDATNRITIGENHSTRTGNVHGLTAADLQQIGALTTTGGNVTGTIDVTGSVNFNNLGGINFNGGHILLGGGRRGISVSNGTITVNIATTPPNPNFPIATDFGIRTQVSPIGGNPTSHLRETAAMVAQSDVPGINGMNTYAPNGTLALFVSGTAQFTGAKTGYVVDTFLNASGQKLRIGDVVKLKGTPITRFQGDANKIPVPEVALADKENDTKVIGIVDRESIPEQDVPDTRVGPEDPTFIENGGELFVVTLGTYAHCKVDATEAPIEVGDLLTSSSNPGHAKKATDPKIGSIIGKALEPLKKGTGYIALFVNIQ